MLCVNHNQRNGLRCSRDPGHLGRCDFDILCICGYDFCLGRSMRSLKQIVRKMKVYSGKVYLGINARIFIGTKEITNLKSITLDPQTS